MHAIEHEMLNCTIDTCHTLYVTAHTNAGVRWLSACAMCQHFLERHMRVHKCMSEGTAH